jgi:hypothetical protein
MLGLSLSLSLSLTILGPFVRTPDIELTAHERNHLAQIKFGHVTNSEIRASIMPMVALLSSLQRRDVIPEARMLYFTDPERNPGGRGRSRQDVFEGNGTAGIEIQAHPSFLQYLEYFVFGPNLPRYVIDQFKETMSFSGYLTHGDIDDLVPVARAYVHRVGVSPHDAAAEFHKLALECGAIASAAEALWRQVKSVRLRR